MSLYPIIVLPAHAGMVPSNARRRQPGKGAPRARGDGPATTSARLGVDVCSPRTRGWSHPCRLRRSRRHVLPAHAGMVPGTRKVRRLRCGAPRARGDGPPRGRAWRAGAPCSPRTRGWSRPGRRSPMTDQSAPRARGDGPSSSRSRRKWRKCSPRTRGWSSAHERWARPRGVLPAHAGMVPRHPRHHTRRQRAPRARGDGPGSSSACSGSWQCSPRTRGWSRALQCLNESAGVLPAHAGMDPRPRRTPRLAAGAPRAREDGPDQPSCRGQAT